MRNLHLLRKLKRRSAEAISLARAGLALSTRGRVGLAIRPVDHRRENILLVVHDATRTGAPIVGWNLAVHLANAYNVYVVCFGDGPLVEDLKAASTGFVGPLRKWRRYPPSVRNAVARSLFNSTKFRFAIINSVAAAGFVGLCRRYGVPTILLVHEFTSTLSRQLTERLDDDFLSASEVVFSSESTASSARRMYPSLAKRQVRVFPQGVSRLPIAAGQVEADSAARSKLQRFKDGGGVVILGAGTVDLRKGVDLFLATAAAVQARSPRVPVHFVWVGGGFRPSSDPSYSVYLVEQLRNCGLEEHFTFIDEVRDLEPIYKLADIFFMSSRLDPMPNVAIDAAYRAIPIVCFDGAGGTGDLLARHAVTAKFAVPYLDTGAAADAILRLVNDPEERAQQGAALKESADAVFDMNSYVARIVTLGLAATVTS